MRARGSVVGLVVAITALVATAAWAHDHKPPKSVLRVQGEKQVGILGTYCWTSPGDEPDTYNMLCIDAIPSWPRAVKADPGRTTKVRFNSSTKPDDLSIAYWKRVDANGSPQGEATTLETTLEPVMNAEGETVAWRLVFKLPESGRHLYLHAAGYWQDQDGSGNPQDASWTYHVRLRQL
jgi:hypothetical protein